MKKIVSSIAALALLTTGLNAANMKYAEEESGNESTYEESAPAATSNNKVNEIGVMFGTATYGLALGVNYHRDLSSVTGDLGPGSLGVELGLNYDTGEEIYYYSYQVTNLNALATYKYAIDSHMSAKVKAGLAYSIYSWEYSGPNSVYWNSYDQSSSDINLVYGASFDYKIDEKIGSVGLAYYGGSYSNMFGVTYTYGF